MAGCALKCYVVSMLVFKLHLMYRKKAHIPLLEYDQLLAWIDEQESKADEAHYHTKESEYHWQNLQLWHTLQHIMHGISKTHYTSLIRPCKRVEATPEQVTALKDLAAAYDRCCALGVTDLQ